MRLIFLLLCLSPSLFACAVHGPPSAQTPGHRHGTGDQDLRGEEELVRWMTLSDAKVEAWVQEKPMVVEFYVAQGCDRCARMEQSVYRDPSIAHQLNGDFVPVRIDLGKALTREEAALGERNHYGSDCLLLFLDFEGNVIEDAGFGKMCFADFVTPAVFSDYLSRARAAANHHRSSSE